MRSRKQRVPEDPSAITIELEPGVQETYRRVLFHPGVFENLIRRGLIACGGSLDEEKKLIRLDLTGRGGCPGEGEPTYDLTTRFGSLMSIFDDLRAEARRPRKGRKKGGRS